MKKRSWVKQGCHYTMKAGFGSVIVRDSGNRCLCMKMYELCFISLKVFKIKPQPHLYDSYTVRTACDMECEMKINHKRSYCYKFLSVSHLSF